ncbi:26S proteasome non-ATPase regulatory subunit 1 [Artemisia annua]|uniref:26S proteasome non-ATPase regulatory subunit 1 n=1 Tax=Artemisia annua TaxID=35608 RepID=A0A2U1P8M1_ARTAN|nr:26S proteasome non-ATPase regulatory subunit 1 [Artemisia annua]
MANIFCPNPGIVPHVSYPILPGLRIVYLTCCEFQHDESLFELPELPLQSQVALEKVLSQRSLQFQNEQQAWQCFYFLREHNDSLSYALGAGSLFDVSEDSDYVHSLLAIDEYASLRTMMAESKESADVDPRLEEIVERMLNKYVLLLLVTVYQDLASPDYLNICECRKTV